MKHIDKNMHHREPKEVKFAEVFLNLLHENDITQLAFAFDNNIASATVSNWCLGKSLPSIDNVMFIADFFDVDIDYLMYG